MILPSPPQPEPAMSSYDYQKEPSMTHRIAHAITLGLILGLLVCIALARLL